MDHANVTVPERKSDAQPPAKPAEIESKDSPRSDEPKPKRVAQRPRYERQAMFEGNPLSGLFNW